VRFALVVWSLALLAAASSCGYDDRSYDGVSFACDATHPCPDGVACVAGRCAGGSTYQGQQGVACGGALCGAGSACCDEIISPLYCTGFGTCEAKELRCDGQEDCPGGTSCCLEGALSICRASCTTVELCSRDADCGADEPFCCAFPYDPSFALRACRPISC
jgi:hypothetical protein